MDLQQTFGAIDVYLFDQLLKGRLSRGMRVLDAGCGGGRNLVYMLREGFDLWGVDASPEAIGAVRDLGSVLVAGYDVERFRVSAIEELPFPATSFDFVICNAVLHFAESEAQFRAMLSAMAGALRPGGIFFARLMTTHGVEDLIEPRGGRRFLLPGGVEVFLADEGLLREVTGSIFRGELVDPLKSTIVHGARTMTTWVVEKGR